MKLKLSWANMASSIEESITDKSWWYSIIQIIFGCFLVAVAFVVFINPYDLVPGGIYGLAIGLIFKSGATSGGSDIISMILHKYTKISLGTLVMIVDSIITLTTLIAEPQLRLPVYSILVIVIEGWIIDLVVDGFNSYKTAFIVTDKAEEVRDIIVKDINRGGTCFFGKGLYKGVDRKMIYVTLTRPELVKLQAALKEVDPNAFLNVVSSTDILGKGFKPLAE